MEKKPPHDESKNRFAEVIRQSQERRAELNNKARKKQMEDIELPPRDEEIVDSRKTTNLRFSSVALCVLDRTSGAATEAAPFQGTA